MKGTRPSTTTRSAAPQRVSPAQWGKFMKYETDPAKRQARVAHRERMKRLNKAQKRADTKYKKGHDLDPSKRKALKAHQKWMKRLDRVDRAKGIFTRKRITVVGVIAFVITVLYYAMIIHSWYIAPIYMFFGWCVEKLMAEGDKAEKGE